MKKIFLFAIVCISFAFSTAQAIQVRVSTPLPLSGCAARDASGAPCISGEKGCFYTCDVQPGFQSVSLLLEEMIKYATFLAALASVLFIVISGIRYTMSGTSGDSDEAKKKIKQVALGLAILYLSGYILHFIAPWIFSI